MKELLILYLFLSITFQLTAQVEGLEPCYKSLYEEGKYFLNLSEPNYPEAFKRFVVARNCWDKPTLDRLDNYINITSTLWVEELDSARIAEKENAILQEAIAKQQEQIANAAQQREQEAKIEEANALRLATFNSALVQAFQAQDSLEDGKVLASLRLATCAYTNLRTYNDSIKTLIASGKNYYKEINIPQNVIKIFGEAVYAYSGKTVYTKQADILDFELAKTNNRFLTIGRDSTLQIWKLTAAGMDSILLIPTKSIHRLDSIKNEGYILSASFSEDGQQVIYCTKNHKAFIWEASEQPIKELAGHKGAVIQGALLKNNTAITIGREGYFLRWNRTTGEQLGEPIDLGLPLLSFTINTQQSKAFVRTSNKVFIVDIESGKVIPIKGHEGQYIYSMALSPNGENILTASIDQTVRVWDLAGNQVGTRIGHTVPVHTAYFHPKEATILTGAKMLRFLNYKGTDNENAIQVAKAEVSKIAFSIDGKHGVALWSNATGRILGSNKVFAAKGAVNAISFSTALNDLKPYFLTGSELKHQTLVDDGLIQIWSVQGELLAEIPIGSPVLDAQFMDAGQYIISITRNGKISIGLNADYVLGLLEEGSHNLNRNCEGLEENKK